MMHLPLLKSEPLRGPGRAAGGAKESCQLSGDLVDARASRSSRWRCLRQRLRMMVQLDDGALLIMPLLLLPAANRQHMIEANGGVLLPELQHRLQIVRRKSDIDDALRQLHLPTITRTLCP